MDLRRSWPGYLGGLLALFAAVALRLLFERGFGEAFPFLPFVLAVGIAAIAGGPGPALLTALGGLLAVDLLSLAPRGSLWVARPEDLAGVAVFLCIAGMLVAFGWVARVQRRRSARAETRLEQLFQLSPVGLAFVDTEGRIFDANPAVREMLGYSREELESGELRWDRLTPQQYAPRDAKAVCQLRESGRAEPYEKELLARNGEFVPVLVGARRLERAGNAVVAATFVTDLRPLKQARRELAQSETRYRHLFATMEQGVVYQDGQGRIIDVNPAAEAILGLSVDQIAGRESIDARWRALREDGSEFPGEEHPSMVALRTGERLSGVVMGVFNPVRRTYRWISVDANPLSPAAGGPPDCVYTLFADITERRQADAALREQAQLLVQAAEKKNRFLATLAHELRNPLAAIQNAVNIAGLNAGGELTGVMGMAARQLRHLRRLVDDLLDISRIDRGRFSLVKETLELQDVVRPAVDAASPRIEQRRHRLALDLPGEPLHLCGDPVRLSQALSNLLVNAANYTPEGGRIRLAARREGESVALAVSDTGRGIPPERLARIFDPFDEREGPVPDGLGLGLALARSIVELHGGRLAATSPGEGAGATFTMRLPLEATGLREEPASEPAASWAAGMRILVVDDNRDAADSTAMLLTALGAAVRVAYDGGAALGAVEAELPELVLLDLGMPGMDGYEVAARLRRRFPEPRPLIVALSGWADEASRLRSRGAGFDYHLAKPLDPEALARWLAGRPESTTRSAL